MNCIDSRKKTYHFNMDSFIETLFYIWCHFLTKMIHWEYLIFKMGALQNSHVQFICIAWFPEIELNNLNTSSSMYENPQKRENK